MNTNFILFNVTPMILGWLGIACNQPFLVAVAVIAVVIRSILLLTLSLKLYFSLHELSEPNLMIFQSVPSSNRALTFIAAVLNMVSLVVWGQFEVTLILAVAMSVYFSTRSRLLNHTA